ASPQIELPTCVRRNVKSVERSAPPGRRTGRRCICTRALSRSRRRPIDLREEVRPGDFRCCAGLLKVGERYGNLLVVRAGEQFEPSELRVIVNLPPIATRQLCGRLGGFPIAGVGDGRIAECSGQGIRSQRGWTLVIRPNGATCK